VTARGLLLVNVAVGLFGLAGILGVVSDLPSPSIVLGRAVSGGLTLLGVATVQRLDLHVRRRDVLLILGQGLLLALHWTTFFQSIVVSNIAIGLLSFATFPLFTAGLEPLLLGTRVSRPQLVGALGILVGIAVLVPEPSFEGGATRGVLWGLVGAGTFAILVVLNRRLGHDYASTVLSAYQNGVAAIVLLPTLLFFPASPMFESRPLVILLILGVGCTAVAHTLFIAGLRHMTAQLASLLVSLEPVWGIALGLLILGEVPTPRSLAGGAIIVGAALLPAVHAAGWLARRRASPSFGRGTEEARAPDSSTA
jgi:drug/metabolite transporter (DMT)-like permease